MSDEPTPVAVEIPEVIARAMRAQGKVQPEEVAEILATGEPPMPSDAEEAERVRLHAAVCHRCDNELEPADREVLIEVIGYSRRRREGGQNHVLARRPTGRVLCGGCARRLLHGLDEADQLTLQEIEQANG